MKDVLKIIRFDFLTAKPLVSKAYLIIVALCFLLSLFFSPMVCCYITFGAMSFVIPLQTIAEKSSFHKLYGILPVKRKNITRARFLFIFLVLFFTELIEIGLALIAMWLRLYRMLPNKNTQMMQMVKTSFSDTVTTFSAIVLMFVSLCLIFAYMEMMGQIFGRENEMKIIVITLSVIVVLAVGFVNLLEHNIIPPFQLPKLPATTLGRVLLIAAMNMVMFGLCTIFGEITANKLARREL